MQLPKIIRGGIYNDARGKISFVNDFRLEGVKRFYTIEHFDTEIIRAWQAHKKEEKWFYVAEGSFLIAFVKVSNWEIPDRNDKADHQVLQSSQSDILFIPGGYANGFRALLPNSKLIVFSNFTSEESALDIYRFDTTLWFNWFDNNLT